MTAFKKTIFPYFEYPFDVLTCQSCYKPFLTIKHKEKHEKGFHKISLEDQIFNLRENGMPFANIGLLVNEKREKVRQIYNREKRRRKKI